MPILSADEALNPGRNRARSIAMKTGANLLKTILVSGLSSAVTQTELRNMFAEHGSVIGVDLVDGQDFGYVRMMNDSEGKRAIEALDGAQCFDSVLSVSAARTRQQRANEQSNVDPGNEVVNC